MRKTLHWIDFLVLSIIFFGYVTYNSLVTYFSSETVATVSASDFTDTHNFWGIIMEVVILLMAGIYLWLMKFDFRSLDFSVNKRTIPTLLLVILLGGLAMDFVLYGYNYFFASPDAISQTGSAYSPFNPFGHITLGLIIFSLVNGFYEELFFMGLTFAVDKKYLPSVVVGSVFVRFIFHTYQGIPSALGVSLLGVVFILIRRRVSSLVPFMIAHAIFDVFGTGILFWIYYFLGYY